MKSTLKKVEARLIIKTFQDQDGTAHNHTDGMAHYGWEHREPSGPECIKDDLSVSGSWGAPEGSREQQEDRGHWDRVKMGSDIGQPV